MNASFHLLNIYITKPYFKGILILCFLFVFFQLNSYSQVEVNSDSIVSENKTIEIDSILYKHSPRKATIYAMILPGLGQAYNKKYWKIPIVYAGFGALFYSISFNDKLYKDYRAAYLHSLTNDGTEPPVNEYEDLYDVDFLLQSKNFYRRNRDLSYILTSLWYLLQMVDATVDAHLLTWEVGEDLSLDFQPVFDPYGIKNQPVSGIKFSLRF